MILDTNCRSLLPLKGRPFSAERGNEKVTATFFGGW
jgi:hypothetical protein